MERKTIQINISYETDVPIDEWTDAVYNDIRQELNCCTYSPNEGTLKITWENIETR